MKKGVMIFWGALVAIIVLGVGSSFLLKSAPGKLDSFAQCLKDKGVIFYGAFWCPHCANTKAMFGNSSKLLPYTECSTPDGQGQLQICKDKNISNYPTWEFPTEGTTTPMRLTGERTLQELSDASKCPLPQN